MNNGFKQLFLEHLLVVDGISSVAVTLYGIVQNIFSLFKKYQINATKTTTNYLFKMPHEKYLNEFCEIIDTYGGRDKVNKWKIYSTF